MSRQYTVTYHHRGITKTLHLSQEQLDTLLAFGDSYPLRSSEAATVKCEWSSDSTDQLWWGNSPLERERGEGLLQAGMFYVVDAGYYH